MLSWVFVSRHMELLAVRNGSCCCFCLGQECAGMGQERKASSGKFDLASRPYEQ